MEFQSFLTLAVRSLPAVSMAHSSVSPAESPRKTAMPSGTVARRDFDLGRAIDDPKEKRLKSVSSENLNT